MENFVAYNPVKLHFGKNVTDKLGKIAKGYGKKVLFVYGKGSVKKNGYYDLIKKQLDNSGLEIFEYSGIKSNPVITDVEKAKEIGIKKNVDLIVALGGGSVIDSAKVVAISVKENLNAWDVVKGNIIPKKGVPLIAVLTLAATGTEMNHFAVVQNHDTKEKIGFRNEFMYPKHSFLDPQFTFSVPDDYTSYGIVDLIAHSFENFFGYGDSALSDRFSAAIIKEAIYYAPLVLKEPENYEYRANIMWQSTCALNGTTLAGKLSGDWGVHSMGHILSLLYDIPHGASLSIAYPAWLKLFKKRIPDRIKKLGKLVFRTDNLDLFIRRLEDFFESINSPIKLQESGIDKTKRNEIVDLFKKNKVGGMHYKLSEEDIEEIVDSMFMTLF